MILSLQFPGHVAPTLQRAWADLPRAVLECLAAEGYRSGRLRSAEVGEMLGHGSRWETEEFLAALGVWPGTTVEEFKSDLATLDRLRGA